MKEKIVVANKAFLNATDFVCIEDVVKDLKVEYTKEQSPETFEELKTICEELESKKIITTSTGIIIEDDCIEFHGLQFWKSGTISHETEIDKGLAIRLNRTPQQMWNIIKSLIGEE